MADDQIEEREALQEVRKLRSKIRHDSRGRLAVVILVAFWVGSSFLGRLLPRVHAWWQWIPAVLLAAAPLAAVWYLEKTSKRFGGASRPKIIARYILLKIVLFLIVIFVPPLLLNLIGESPYAVLAWSGLYLWLPILGGSLIWKRWFGFGLPWLFAFLTEMLMYWLQQSLGITWRSPWGSAATGLSWVVAGYVCLDSTLRRLRLKEES